MEIIKRAIIEHARKGVSIDFRRAANGRGRARHPPDGFRKILRPQGAGFKGA